MKRLLLCIASVSGLLAQTAPVTPAAAGISPVPPDEPVLSGSLDLGYRWVPGTGGNLATYRSIVDLGSGPKLLGADFTIINQGRRFFDRINVRAADWGHDPYSTLHIDVSRKKLYDFSGDYRNIAYYNNLPGFADPLAGSGLILNEQARDTRQRIGNWRLDLLPNRVFMPYLEYDRNSDNGTGIATFVANADEYPVTSLIRDSNQNYRGGVRIELSRLHIKVEQGGTRFRDDQRLNAGSGQTNYGNLCSPILGQTLDLTSLSEAYGVRGHSVSTDASFSANPVSWADLYGAFLYSEPVSTVNFTGLDTGNQVLLSQVLFYTGEQNLITAASKLPHSSANLGAEIRPFGRLRLVPSWLTDRINSSGSGTGQQTLTTASGVVPIASLLSSALVENSSQAAMEAFFDVTRKLTVHGGYRYVWGNASDVILPIAGLAGLEAGKIRRSVGIAGLSWHPVQNAWVNLDFEDGSSGSTYFRTSLYNYQKARIRGRHRITPALSVSASVSVLNNRNPSPGIDYAFLSHQESASLQFSPGGGKIWDFEGGYTRSTLRSNIGYLDPEFLIPEQSLYRDNSHTVTAMFNLNMPAWMRYKTRLALGGSALLSSGSNPTTFYQPAAKVSIAVRKNISWIGEWRYYGFGESFYLYQGFRTQTVTAGVRITR
ncbi:MAG TPA: hypothetical protein VFC21_07495 [Bryobacteraceae bacterium]|nr:hypothetical protein [Bryobacteraceae bacterium]